METIGCQVVRKNRLRKGYIRLFDNWKRIGCKPTCPCKLWKLQSESLDQHSRGMGDWVILQSRPTLDWVITLL